MNDLFAPIAGVPLKLAEDLAVVLAPNPSPMTYLGTNTYLLGHDALVLIDPGPDDARHFASVVAAIDGRLVTHILVTHSHLDHSPLSAKLAQQCSCPIFAFGDSLAGRSKVMTELTQEEMVGGGEGIDQAFQPTTCLADGDVLQTQAGAITAIHTPGHMGNHMCFAWRQVIFTGDHIMGWASSLVSPPDGDLTDFMASCRRLNTLPAQVYYPGHGAPIHQPHKRLNWLVDHRLQREAQILETISRQPQTVTQITTAVYHDVAPALRKAAERNVFAHLIDLHLRGHARAQPQLSPSANFIAPTA